MGFLRSPLGACVILLLLGGGLLLGATIVQVERAMRPERHAGPPIDFESMLIQVDLVSFTAADGVPLTGWLLRGKPGMPPVILCHDLGQSKASLLQLAIALRKEGFTALLFDFRGHGQSGGTRSTLGLSEKRDVLGAAAFLKSQEDLEIGEIGLYGVGMGAHAAVLAAADRSTFKALALDGLYPDVGYSLVRNVYPGWEFGKDRLGFLPRGIFCALNQTSISDERADDKLRGMLGRDLLLLAPTSDSRLAGEIRKMYEQLPEQSDVDGNLVMLPRTSADGLYGDHLVRYQQHVTEFFVGRIPAS